MTTTITIQTGGHAVRMLTDEGAVGSEQIIAPHTTQTVHIWQGRGLTLAEVLEQKADDAPTGVEAMPSTLQAGEDLGASVQRPDAPRVALNAMQQKVKSVEFVYPACAQHMTVAMVELENRFVLVGKSAPADPKNFDVEVGKRFALDDALRQLWQLEGYLLREKLHQREAVAKAA